MHAGELSPLDLFMQAGPVVKTVFVLLLLSSIWCWTIILRGTLGLLALRTAAGQLAAGSRTGTGARSILEAGRHEAGLDCPSESPAERQSRVTSAMRRRASELSEREQVGLPNLAVISSVAPFVGLFGTVWGIMTSFIGIAAAKDSSLAVVAPGIAEALGATAAGLAAAIPAAFAYNRLAAAFARQSRRLSRLAEDRAREIVRAANLR